MIDDAYRKEVAGELRTHLVHLSEPQRSDLRALAQAVTDPTDAPAWSGIDLEGYFVPDMPVESRLGAKLDVVRLPLVFVPILVTWFGIWAATEAHRRLREAGDVAADLPFLDLWQTGFAGETWLTLGLVALIDVAAIAVIVLLSVLVSFSDLRADRRRREWAINADSLQTALRRAERIVDTDVVQSPQDVQREFSKAINSLTQLDAAAEAAQEIVTRFESLQESTERIEESSEVFARSSVDFAQQVDGLETAVSGLSSTSASLASHVGTAAHQLKVSTDALQSSASVLAEALDAIVTNRDSFSDVLSGQVDTLELARGVLAGTNDALGETRTKAVDMASTMERAAKELNDGESRMAKTLVDAIGQMHALLTLQSETLLEMRSLEATTAVLVDLLQQGLLPIVSGDG